MEEPGPSGDSASAVGLSSQTGTMGSTNQISDTEEFKALTKILFPQSEDYKLGIAQWPTLHIIILLTYDKQTKQTFFLIHSFYF